MAGLLAVGVLASNGLRGLDEEAAYGLPLLFVGGLLTFAALVVALLSKRAACRGIRGVRAYRGLAVSLVALAVLVVDLAVRLEELAPLPGLAGAFLAAGVALLALRLGHRGLACAGIVLLGGWLAALASPPIGDTVGWLLGVAGGWLAVLTLVGVARSDARGPILPFRQVAVAYARTLDVRLLAVAVACAIGAFALLGLLFDTGALPVASFDINTEQVPPAVFAGALLLGAGACALLLATTDARHRPRPTWAVLGAVLLFLGVDEITALHEALQDRTGIKGQVILAPVVLIGGIAGGLAVRRLWGHPWAGPVFLGGGLVWVVAQAIDLLQRPPDRLMWTVVPEEVLEMTGSAFFLLALLAAVRRCPELSRARRSGWLGEVEGPAS